MFDASGTLPLNKRPKFRQTYRLMELRRWRDHLDLPLNLHPRYFPVDEALAARMVVAHRQSGHAQPGPFFAGQGYAFNYGSRNHSCLASLPHFFWF